MASNYCDQIDIEFLITLVEARPVLWDKTLEEYKDKVLTKNAWAEICKELHTGFEEMSDKEKNEFGEYCLLTFKLHFFYRFATNVYIFNNCQFTDPTSVKK